MEVLGGKKLKALEAENANLEMPLADQMLYVSTPREMLRKSL